MKYNSKETDYVWRLTGGNGERLFQDPVTIGMVICLPVWRADLFSLAFSISAILL